MVLTGALTGISSVEAKKSNCATIQDGTILASDGNVIETGFDQWGYNYQSHMFNGTYCDAYRDASWCQEYKDVSLSMKWNDAWLSNKDCDGDNFLDRHYGYGSYIGSGAWLTNHQAGEYEGEDGEMCHWTYFVKIVAMNSDDYVNSGVVYDSEGNERGLPIWGSFVIIQKIVNDPCAGAHGVAYLSPMGPGLGNNED